MSSFVSLSRILHFLHKTCTYFLLILFLDRYFFFVFLFFVWGVFVCLFFTIINGFSTIWEDKWKHVNGLTTFMEVEKGSKLNLVWYSESLLLVGVKGK